MDSHRIIIEAATGLAGIMPSSTVESVAVAIRSSGTSSLQAEIAKRIPHHHHRDPAVAFVERWKQEAGDVEPNTVAVALQTAALSEQKHRDSQSVELVWTGPDTGDLPFRRTEQAILQLLDSAQDRITLVSFAVYRIPNIAKALIRAANRGVKLAVIVETPDKLGGENEYSTLRALGKEGEACSSVYFWPKENRTSGDDEKVGILHVKCAVADGEWLFLSSANLTQQAFTINMELGILVRGGTMPRRVERQFEGLVDKKILEPI